MKRILAILCAMACLFALALPAMAADKITVTAYVPKGVEGWKIHFWGGTGPESTWPGVDMVKVEDGVYEVEIDSGYTGFLIHSNENPKSADLSMSGTEDVWVVYDGTNASVHPTDPGKGATPTPGGNTGDLSGLNELYIVGTGMTGIDEWSTTCANGKMTANGTTYTISLGLNKGTAIAFKFAGNGSWDSGFNMGGEGETALTAGTPATMKNDGGSGNFTYTASQDCNLTVTVDMAANTVKVEEVAGTPIVPEPVPGGNEGGNQGGNTGNLSGLEFLCIVGEGLDSLSWDPAAETGKMEGKDGVYTFELDLGEGSTIKFKFCGNGAWDKGFDFGGASADPIVNGTAASLAAGGQDMFYTGAGKITVTADLNANTVTITGGSEIKEDPKDETTEPTTTPDAPKKEEKKDNTTLFIILGIVGVIAAGTAVAVVIILKKK